MNLTALVLTMCVYTSLDCEKVDVAYADLADGQLGRVTSYSNGYKTIEVANYLKNKYPYRTRNVIMQQLTYLEKALDAEGVEDPLIEDTEAETLVVLKGMREEALDRNPYWN